MVLIDSPHIIHMSIQNPYKSYLAILPSIHRIYEYGSIAIKKLFDINISKKIYIKRGNDQMENLTSLFPSATRCNDTNTHNALFSQKALFLLFETGRVNGYSQYCKLVPQHSQLLYYRVYLGLKVIKRACLKSGV